MVKGILQTINSQPSSCFFGSILQISNDRVLDIFLLFTQKCAETEFNVYDRNLYSLWINWSKSSCILPSMLTTLFSLVPYALELKTASLISCLTRFNLPKMGNRSTPRLWPYLKRMVYQSLLYYNQLSHQDLLW